jgi:hypothetical protein
MREESSFLARSNSRRRVGARLRPARLMKYVSMRMPEPGPLGETFFDARTRAIVLASLLNNPGGGWVESVVTWETHRFVVFFFAEDCFRGMVANLFGTQ